MSLTLHVDAARWRAHLAAFAEQTPGLIPVVKGNGYGFGRRLAITEASDLDAQTLAVGTYAEALEALDSFGGDVVVLSPWRPGQRAADHRLVHTVSRPEDVAALAEQQPGARAYLEGATSVTRHGMDQLSAAGGLTVEGVSIHLPLAGHGDNLAEASEWADRLLASGLPPSLTVSHMTPLELAALAKRHPDVTVRLRAGTALWLGDPSTLTVRATVLDVHEVKRGQRVGYRQLPLKRSGHLIVIGAGTANGVGLDAPKAAAVSLAERGKSVARGSLEAAGWARSPFVIDHRQRWYAEPPHMHHSLVLLPSGGVPPAIGDEVEAQVRYTTTSFDHISFD